MVAIPGHRPLATDPENLVNSHDDARFNTPLLTLHDILATSNDMRSRIPLLLIDAAPQETLPEWTRTHDARLKVTVDSQNPRRHYIGPRVPLDPTDATSVEAAANAIYDWRLFGGLALTPPAGVCVAVAGWTNLPKEVHETLALAARSIVDFSTLPTATVVKDARKTTWRDRGDLKHLQTESPASLPREVRFPSPILDMRGRFRDYAAAKRIAKSLHTDGWLRADIRRYLTVFGYQNANDIVGSWERTGHLNDILEPTR